VTHEGSDYDVCEADLRRHAVRLFWQSSNGQTYGHLSALPPTLGAAGQRLLFATNGGMFHADYRPVGLYVEGGRQLSPANTRAGPGNFHMKPNGVFYVSGATVGVLETGGYLKAAPKADYATQSGPMLVIAGRLHPRFTRNGDSRKMRNGVGVRDAGVALFAVSQAPVSFGEFARLFRDKLKTPNALFLDGGSVPSLYVPGGSRGGNVLAIGPMIGVYGR
jgi:uncharacterized protein YigE (DUF2233 family)